MSAGFRLAPKLDEKGEERATTVYAYPPTATEDAGPQAFKPRYRIYVTEGTRRDPELHATPHWSGTKDELMYFKVSAPEGIMFFASPQRWYEWSGTRVIPQHPDFALEWARRNGRTDLKTQALWGESVTGKPSPFLASEMDG
jgi:hypothetical protein